MNFELLLKISTVAFFVLVFVMAALEKRGIEKVFMTFLFGAGCGIFFASLVGLSVEYSADTLGSAVKDCARSLR